MPTRIMRTLLHRGRRGRQAPPVRDRYFFLPGMLMLLAGILPPKGWCLGVLFLSAFGFFFSLPGRSLAMTFSSVAVALLIPAADTSGGARVCELPRPSPSASRSWAGRSAHNLARR